MGGGGSMWRGWVLLVTARQMKGKKPKQEAMLPESGVSSGCFLGSVRLERESKLETWMFAIRAEAGSCSYLATPGAEFSI